VAQLCRIPVKRPYAATMQFVFVMTWIATSQAIMEHVVFRPTPPLGLVLGLVGLLIELAAFLLCLNMRWMASEYELPVAAESWRMTALLAGLIWLAPSVAWLAISAVIIGLGVMPWEGLLHPALIIPFVVVAFALSLIPIIHFRISISRMQREMVTQYHALQALAASPSGAGG
jgi:hypothetical protein